MLVSILVLMEDVKEQEFNKELVYMNYDVSILVLMEDVKELDIERHINLKMNCFNPCFNGRCKRTFLNCFRA